MKIQKKNLILGALALAAALGSVASQAATITQCANLARPAGYLTVQTGIPSSCSTTRMSTKYETPRDGLRIRSWSELQTLPEPWGVTTIEGVNPNYYYTIKAAREGLQVCALFPPPYNWVSKKAGITGSCGQVSNFSDSVTWHKIFTSSVSKASSGAPSLSVVLNPAIPNLYNYAVRTTATLNGASTTVVKTGLTGTGTYGLSVLAPSLVSQVAKGASFTFQIDMFNQQTKVADEFVVAP